MKKKHKHTTQKATERKKMFSFDTLSQMTTQMFFELLLLVAIGG